MNLIINLNFKIQMKTINNLKAFCLNKKQMNETTGGAIRVCDQLVIMANKFADQWSQAELDEWGNLFEKNCK